MRHADTVLHTLLNAHQKLVSKVRVNQVIEEGLLGMASATR
ncbi:hypothetical protein M998_1750 [Providencia heimbachae ATCC 35613]|uniref:Uncharacterized protein n=1 Tax=Providencia heimbachae ATCC 35613 TaxID=1354272 RepID=A0A1B7JVT4_9GAMM|nr:hypothetical protein M998_1750 [Providencia heimbachae ATCC 35613]